MSDEHDPLRSAFDELRSSALPAMRPLGVDGVVTAVRHRRNVRTTVATAAVLVLASIGFGVAGLVMRGHATPSTAANSGPGLTTMPSGAPSPSAPPSAVTFSSAPPSSSGVPRSHRTAPTHTPPRKACVTDGVAVGGGENGLTVTEQFASLVKVGQEPLCAGASVPLFWASYSVNSDGTGSLYSSGGGTLTSAHPTAVLQISEPGSCGEFFTGYDWTGIPQTAPAQVQGDFPIYAGGSFWDAKHNKSGLVYAGQTLCSPTPPDNSPSPGASAAN